MRNFSQKGQGQPAQKEKNGQKLESTVPYDKPTPALHIIWQNLTITTIRCRVKLDINTRNKEQHTRQGNTQMRHFSFILFKWYIKVLQANTCMHEQKAMVKQNPMTLAMRQKKTIVALDTEYIFLNFIVYVISWYHVCYIMVSCMKYHGIVHVHVISWYRACNII